MLTLGVTLQASAQRPVTVGWTPELLGLGGAEKLLRLVTAQKQGSSYSPWWPPKEQTHHPQVSVTHLRPWGLGGSWH